MAQSGSALVWGVYWFPIIFNGLPVIVRKRTVFLLVFLKGLLDRFRTFKLTAEITLRVIGDNIIY